MVAENIRLKVNTFLYLRDSSRRLCDKGMDVMFGSPVEEYREDINAKGAAELSDEIQGAGSLRNLSHRQCS